MTESRPTSYYHADAHGSDTMLTDADGDPAAREVYDAWGNTISVTSGGTGRFGYYIPIVGPDVSEAGGIVTEIGTIIAGGGALVTTGAYVMAPPGYDFGGSRDRCIVDVVIVAAGVANTATSAWDETKDFFHRLETWHDYGGRMSWSGCGD